MSNTAKLQLGFSPLTKKIHLAKMKDVAPGVRVRVGNDRGRDVTDEAAQLVWQLVMAEGGEVAWQLKDGIRMVLKAEEVDKEPAPAPARYEFDEPALNIAQKIMECRATAAAEGWPDVRLKAAIQCLVIEAMKWAAPEQHHNGMMMLSQELAEVKRKLAECPAPNRAQVFIDGNLSGEAMDELLRQINKASPEIISIHPATSVPKGWKVVPAEITQEMAVAAAPYTDVKEYYRALLAAAPAPGSGDDCRRCGGSGTIDYPQGKANVDCPVCEGTRKAAGGDGT